MQDIIYQILSELAEVCRRCNKNIMASFFLGRGVCYTVVVMSIVPWCVMSVIPWCAMSVCRTVVVMSVILWCVYAVFRSRLLCAVLYWNNTQCFICATKHARVDCFNSWCYDDTRLRVSLCVLMFVSVDEQLLCWTCQDLNGDASAQAGSPDEIEDLEEFVLRPATQKVTMKCRITRDKKGVDRTVYPTYYLHLEREDGRKVSWLILTVNRQTVSTKYGWEWVDIQYGFLWSVQSYFHTYDVHTVTMWQLLNHVITGHWVTSKNLQLQVLSVHGHWSVSIDR